MKKLLYLLCSVIFIACDDGAEPLKETGAETTVTDSIKKYRGDYISVKDQAVLKDGDFVYQIKMDSVAWVLEKKLQEKGIQNGKIVPVVVKGKVIENPDRKGYSKMLEIKEVLAIEAENSSEN